MAEPTLAAASEPPAANLRAMLLIGAGWTALAAFDLWLLLVRPDASWETKIGFVLGLVGIYTFAFGMLAQTRLLDRFPRLGENLTSPNPARLLGGCFETLALASYALSIGIAPERTSGAFERRGGTAIWLAQLPIMLAGVLLFAAGVLLYLLVVAPLAWVAYVLASAPLDSIVNAGRDIAISETTTSTGEVETVYIKEFVEENLVTLRNLLVAVPALVSSLILNAPKLR